MSRVQEKNPHAAPSLQSEKLHARHLHNSPLKILTKLLPRRGGYMHQYLARLSGSVVDIQVNHGGNNWIYNLRLEHEMQQGEDTYFWFTSDEMRRCLSLQPLGTVSCSRILRCT
jgi:hypothetical protein